MFKNGQRKFCIEHYIEMMETNDEFREQMNRWCANPELQAAEAEVNAASEAATKADIRFSQLTARFRTEDMDVTEEMVADAQKAFEETQKAHLVAWTRRAQIIQAAREKASPGITEQERQEKKMAWQRMQRATI
jgi:hypothetical protein